MFMSHVNNAYLDYSFQIPFNGFVSRFSESISKCNAVSYLTVLATYPGEVALEAVDVQLRLLGVDVGVDGEQVL